MKTDRPVILIPAYNPDNRFIDVLKDLTRAGFKIVVVDDGSVDCGPLFDEAKKYAEVLSHEVNRGKGVALKTGLKYIGSHDVVTADCDGQHKIEDIEKVAAALEDGCDKLVIGTRRFRGKVPFRSAFGNFWTRLYFFLATWVKVYDTQSGLRGIPASMVESVLDLPGDRYEYEMAVLAGYCRRKGKPVEVTIDTVYIDGNKSSHFQPMRDTIKIYKAMFRR